MGADYVGAERRYNPGRPRGSFDERQRIIKEIDGCAGAGRDRRSLWRYRHQPSLRHQECFSGAHPLAPDEPHILGVLSLVFWAVMAVVSFKYVRLMMRADNRGQGGSLALLALVSQLTRDRPAGTMVMSLGIFAAALFYGNSMRPCGVKDSSRGCRATRPAPWTSSKFRPIASWNSAARSKYRNRHIP